MSIAASVVINPSRLLQRLTAALGLGIALVGCRFALLGFSGAITPAGSQGALVALAYLEPATPASLMEMGLAALLIFIGCSLLYSSTRRRKSFQLDISGVGEIRLREHYTRAALRSSKSSRESRQHGETVQLTDDCTIWPKLLALRLRRQDGRLISMIVLPDMVTADGFRALVIAVQWIASRERAGATGSQQEETLR